MEATSNSLSEAGSREEQAVQGARESAKSYQSLIEDKDPYMSFKQELTASMVGSSMVSLHQAEGVASYVKTTFSIFRVVFTVIIVGLAVAGSYLVSPTHFSHFVTEQALSPKGCQLLCLNTHDDHVKYKKLGGTGICKKGDEWLTKFKVCEVDNPQACVTLDQNEKISDTHQDDDKVLFTKCIFKVAVASWHPWFVTAFFILGVMLVLQNVAAEIVFTVLCCIFVGAGILTASEGFAGFANPAVVGLAFIFPITKAVEETGFVDKAVAPLLGLPTNSRIATFKVYMLAMLMSGVISNSPLTVIMIPIVNEWCRKMQVSKSKMLMPMAYGVMAGGNLTAVGTVASMVAVVSMTPIMQLGFCDMALPCFATSAALGLAIALVAPTSLLKASNESPDSAAGGSGGSDKPKPGTYNVPFQITEGGAFIGKAGDEVVSDIGRRPGITSATSVNMGKKLEGGEILEVRATPEGIAYLRRIDGLELMAESSLRMLGSHRRARQLFEGAVAKKIDDSPLSVLSDEILREKLHLALLASRGPSGSTPWDTRTGGSVQEGDVLLFEASSTDVTKMKDRYGAAFSVLRPVPNSTPPRRGEKFDMFNSIFVFSSFFILLVLVATGLCSLAWGAGVLVALLLVARSITKEQVFASMNIQVLFTIGSGIGLAAAISKTGIANVVAQQAMIIAGPLGIMGLTGAIYLVSSILGLFIHQGAIVSLMAPVIISMAQTNPDLTIVDLRTLTYVTCFAATLSMSSNLASPPNMLVSPHAGYTITDFVRLGLPMQILHFVICVLLIPPLVRLQV